jgi:Flp pilus assembly pilin Flp
MDAAVSLVADHAVVCALVAVVIVAAFVCVLVILVKHGYKFTVTWRSGGIHIDPPKK